MACLVRRNWQFQHLNLQGKGILVCGHFCSNSPCESWHLLHLLVLSLQVHMFDYAKKIASPIFLPICLDILMHFAYKCQWGCWLLCKHMCVCVLSLVSLGMENPLPIPQAQLWCLSLQLSKTCPSMSLLWCWYIVALNHICFFIPCWHWGFFVATVQCPGMCVSHLDICQNNCPRLKVTAVKTVHVCR